MQKQPYETRTAPNTYSHGRHIASDAIRGAIVGLRGYFEGRKMRREAKTDREKRIAEEAYRQRTLELQEKQVALGETRLTHEQDTAAAEQARKDAEEARAAEAEARENDLRTQIDTDQSLLDDNAEQLAAATDPEEIQALQEKRKHITQRQAKSIGLLGKSVPGLDTSFEEPKPTKPATQPLTDFKAWLEQSGNYTDDEIAELLDKAAKGQFKIPDTDTLSAKIDEQDRIVDDGVETGIFTAEEAERIKRENRRNALGLDPEKQTLADQYQERIKLIEDLPVSDDRKGILSQRAAEELVGVKPTSTDELEDYIDFVQSLPDSIINPEKKAKLIEQAIGEGAPGTSKTDPKDLSDEKREGYLKLLSEFRQSPFAKDINDIFSAWTRGKAAVELALDGNRSSQITIVNAFMQMTDPGVSVREGEFESARKNLSDVLAQADLTIKRFVDGEGGFIMDKDGILDMFQTMQTIHNRTVDVWETHPAGKASLMPLAEMFDIVEEADFMNFEKDTTTFEEDDTTQDYHYTLQKGDDGFDKKNPEMMNITATVRKYFQQGETRARVREGILDMLKNLDAAELDAILDRIYGESTPPDEEE